jgi:hypothetical protein
VNGPPIAEVILTTADVETVAKLRETRDAIDQLLGQKVLPADLRQRLVTLLGRESRIRVALLEVLEHADVGTYDGVVVLTPETLA